MNKFEFTFIGELWEVEEVVEEGGIIRPIAIICFYGFSNIMSLSKGTLYTSISSSRMLFSGITVIFPILLIIVKLHYKIKLPKSIFLIPLTLRIYCSNISNPFGKILSSFKSIYLSFSI